MEEVCGAKFTSNRRLTKCFIAVTQQKMDRLDGFVKFGRRFESKLRFHSLWLCNQKHSQFIQVLQPPEIRIEDCDAADLSRNSSTREIEIEFTDSENEKKFDKLVTEKKIKSPFKRRLSNERLVENNGKDSQIDKRTKMDGSEESPKKRHRTDSSESSSTGSSFQNQCAETDPDVLERRQKQIDYGKNTIGYDNYIRTIPKWVSIEMSTARYLLSKITRDRRTKDCPKTPPKGLKYSRRAWEGLVKSWRKKLHTFDPRTPTDDKLAVKENQDWSEDES